LQNQRHSAQNYDDVSRTVAALTGVLGEVMAIEEDVFDWVDGLLAIAGREAERRSAIQAFGRNSANMVQN
jgi:hypothetical protein